MALNAFGRRIRDSPWCLTVLCIVTAQLLRYCTVPREALVAG